MLNVLMLLPMWQARINPYLMEYLPDDIKPKMSDVVKRQIIIKLLVSGF